MRSATSNRRPRVAPRPYHHGDLGPALLRAAETVLQREGVDGITLRAVAREAGVSHTAPQHHFGDLTGLLSELAAVGFRRFRDAMLDASDRSSDQRAQGRARGRAYLAFARGNPQMFLLMFRGKRLDMRRPALQTAADGAFAVLAASSGVERTPEHVSLSQAASITSVWAIVHGLAMLAIDGRLHPIIAALPEGTSEDELLDAALASMAPRIAPGTATRKRRMAR